MSKYAVATTTTTISLACPACGKKVRGEVVKAATASVGFFVNPTEAEAKSEALRGARSQSDALLARADAYDRSVFVERGGVKLTCSCGYESAAATFAVYFWVLMAGLGLAFVGVGVPLLVFGTVWYLRKRAKMDRLLDAGMARGRVSTGRPA